MSMVGLPLTLIFALCGAGALLGFMIPERRNPALLAWVGSLAALLALWTAGYALFSDRVFHGDLWTIRAVGTLHVSLDHLSALFVFAAALVVLPSSIFSTSYLRRYLGRYSLKTFNAWYLLLFASIVLILIAHDVLLFLLAWEAMSILSYLLVNFEHERDESSRAGFLMLAMGEMGFVALAIILLFLAVRAGSLQFSALQAASAGLSATARWIVFLVTFFGFGVKAGLVPVNTWMPRAHPAAPANVSAILSGVILNLGLYGIIRMNLYLVPVTMLGAGVVVLIVGTISALVGILYASTENDLKTMLAHSSIENIGIVTVGLGAGLVFTAFHLPVLAAIAFVVAMYHMINHSMYKTLLFLGAGAVDNAAGTRDMNRLGGLIRLMPATALLFLVGALAISAMPPLNGFVSEWLTLQTLLRSAEIPSTPIKIVFALCGAGLALTIALAVTCFVKAFAMSFLGMARSTAAGASREAPRSMLIGMAIPAILCVLLGLTPTWILPLLNRILHKVTNSLAAHALVPPFFAGSPGHKQLPRAFMAGFHNIGAQVGENILPGRGLVVLHRGGTANPVVFAMSTFYMAAVLVGMVLITWLIVRWLTRRRTVRVRAPWDGGVRRLLPEMTYTATGFSNPVRVIFDAIFRPTIAGDTKQTVAEHFRTAIQRQRQEVHIVDRLALQPIKSVALRLARGLAALHHGRINMYIAYGLLSLLLVLALGWLL